MCPIASLSIVFFVVIPVAPCHECLTSGAGRVLGHPGPRCELDDDLAPSAVFYGFLRGEQKFHVYLHP